MQRRTTHQLHARVVDDDLLVLQVGVALRDLAAALDEQAVRALHDVGLVHRGDRLAAVLARVLERKLGDAR